MTETKRCADCAKVKPLHDFSRNARTLDGRRNECTECRNEHRRTIRAADYEDLLVKQDYRCGICGVKETDYPRKFSVDHDHSDYSIRGLLCHGCNTAIGMLDEDVDFLKAAIGYLLHHKTTIIQGE